MGRESRARRERAAAEEERHTTRNRMVAPEMLISIGAIVPASWHVPLVRREALERGGKPSPEPIRGAMLVDTGATTSSIDDEVAMELGLDKVGERHSMGLGGRIRRRVVHAVLEVPFPFGAMVYAGEVACIRGFRDTWRAEPPLLNEKPIDIIGLLGRDILLHMKLAYDGVDGSYTLRFDRRRAHGLSEEQARRLIGGRNPK